MLTLTPIKTKDQVEWLRVQRSRPELYRYFRQDKPLTVLEQRRWWETTGKYWGRVRLFIINDGNSDIGYVGFNPFFSGQRAEFGIFILPEFQGRGYGKEAMLSILKKGFEEYKLSVIYSDVLMYIEEPDRFEFYKKLGFVKYPDNVQTISYRKSVPNPKDKNDTIRISVRSIKFYMDKDMWVGIYGKNGKGPVGIGASEAAPKEAHKPRPQRSSVYSS